MQKPSLLKHFRDILILPFTITVILPYLLYNSQQGQQFNNIIFKVSGALFGVGGLVLFIYTVFLFRTIGKGTLAPWSPTQKLIIKGPYKYCRNPMIPVYFLFCWAKHFSFTLSAYLTWPFSFSLLIRFTLFGKKNPICTKDSAKIIFIIRKMYRDGYQSCVPMPAITEFPGHGKS